MTQGWPAGRCGLIWATLCLTALPLAAVPSLRAGSELAVPSRIRQTYGRLPLRFEANQGQAGKGVRFLSRGPGYTCS